MKFVIEKGNNNRRIKITQKGTNEKQCFPDKKEIILYFHKFIFQFCFIMKIILIAECAIS